MPSSSPSRADTGAIENRGSGPSGRSEVRHQHEPRALLAQVLDRRQRGADAPVVRHAALAALTLERDVEVDSHERRARPWI